MQFQGKMKNGNKTSLFTNVDQIKPPVFGRRFSGLSWFYSVWTTPNPLRARTSRVKNNVAVVPPERCSSVRGRLLAGIDVSRRFKFPCPHSVDLLHDGKNVED